MIVEKSKWKDSYINDILTHAEVTKYLHSIFRDILSFVLIPITQREVNRFKDEVWNVHRIRAQKNRVV